MYPLAKALGGAARTPYGFYICGTLVKRVANLQRIRHLPQDTQLRKVYEQRYWHSRGYIFKKYEDDLREVQASLKLTTTPQEQFDHAISNPPTATSRKILKQVCSEIDQSERFHRLRINHMELLEGIKVVNLCHIWRNRLLESQSMRSG